MIPTVKALFVNGYPPYRKDLTPSEKVALAMQIEKALEGRNHRPSKSTPNLAELEKAHNAAPPTPETENNELPQNFGEVPKGESRDIAAKAMDKSLI